MRAIATLAALLVLLQAPQPAPNGVKGSLAVINAERAWAGADVLPWIYCQHNPECWFPSL